MNAMCSVAVFVFMQRKSTFKEQWHLGEINQRLSFGFVLFKHR